MAIEWQPLVNDDDLEEEKDVLQPGHRPQSPTRKITVLRVVTAVSVLLNIIVLSLLYSHSSSHERKSDYAGLTWTEKSPWTPQSEYYDRRHRTKSNENWASINWDAGIVAITDDEAKEMGLPLSQRFPWDDSKGIYLMNGYHNLHCLQWLWVTLDKFQRGVPFDWTDWHAFHCVEQLRQDTLCYADDTPRYSGEGQDNETGSNQNRTCRDWGKMTRWAEERSACYRFLNDTVQDATDRYKFCPEDSPYNAKMEALLGPGERQRLIDLYGEVAA